MDWPRIFLCLFVCNLITIQFSKAEPEITNTATLGSMFRRNFEWKTLNGKSLARHSKSDSLSDDGESRAVYFIPTTCDPEVERGYTCIACGESLHCMGGGFALKAVCFGRRPFCNNGVCSSTRGSKCEKISDTHEPVNASHTDVVTQEEPPKN